MNPGVSVLEARIKAALTLAGQKRLNGDVEGARELALSVLAIDEEHIEARRLLTELLAWPSMVAPSESLPAPSRTDARHVPARSASRRSSRTGMMAMVGGVGVVAAGALVLASGFLRSDTQVVASPSPPPPPTTVPAVVQQPQTPDQAAARPVDPEILRRAEALRVQADARRAADEAAAGIREARAAADRAQAAELASPLFQKARILEAEAARSYERQLWSEAVAKGLAAARAYKEAQGQADAEATRLQFEQARARAAEMEQARRAADAAAAQRAATPAASANPQETDRAAIVAVIKGYSAAMQAKDLAGLKALWPSLGGTQEAKVRSGFEFAKSLRVQIEVTGVQITGGAAVVTCQRKDTVVTQEGQTVQSDRTAVIRLIKNPHGWSIAAIQ